MPTKNFYLTKIVEKVNVTAGYPTVDELVSTLRRSKLPTVVVEGKDDMQSLRWMEDIVKAHEVDVLGVGGRLIYLLSMIEEANSPIYLLLLLLIEIDYLFKNPPNHYEDIIWTEGYSIENDLYAGGEPVLEKLLNQ